MQLKDIVERRGSSPHTRGARFRDRALLQLRRIIPAYAGSTPQWLRASARAADHPRIRGEHLKSNTAEDPRKGSSPHTRGAHYSIAVYHRRLGIIPAYAGSTMLFSSPSLVHMDHPRIRGEHTSTAGAKGISQGSSPHTRGAPTNSSHRRRKVGIIPAYAGSTCE